MMNIFRKETSSSLSSNDTKENLKFKSNCLKLYNHISTNEALTEREPISAIPYMNKINTCKMELFINSDNKFKSSLSSKYMLGNNKINDFSDKIKSPVYNNNKKEEFVESKIFFNLEKVYKKDKIQTIKTGIYKLLERDANYATSSSPLKTRLYEKKNGKPKNTVDEKQNKLFAFLLEKKSEAKNIDENTQRLNKMKDIVGKTLQKDFSFDKDFTKKKLDSKSVTNHVPFSNLSNFSNLKSNSINPLISKTKLTKIPKSDKNEKNDGFFGETDDFFGSGMLSKIKKENKNKTRKGDNSLQMRLDFLNLNTPTTQNETKNLDTFVNYQNIISPRITNINFFDSPQNTNSTHRRIKSLTSL